MLSECYTKTLKEQMQMHDEKGQQGLLQTSQRHAHTLVEMKNCRKPRKN